MISSHHKPPLEEQPMQKTVLVVEDDESIGEFLVDVIQEIGLYQVVLATDGFQALQIGRESELCLVVLDYQLPGMNGVELYDQFHCMEGKEGVPAFFVSADVPSRALEKRHLRCVSKPFELEELFQAIEHSLAE